MTMLITVKRDLADQLHILFDIIDSKSDVRAAVDDCGNEHSSTTTLEIRQGKSFYQHLIFTNDLYICETKYKSE